ncbi:hypothetical protein [Borrelia sp. HM]|uniref:hypothetical protein n=1 Tax=Borrelia sp. HM TaxID=1882662 RepID=UPI001C758DF3|nr:hypothetical protein [Borrelia sp. HM]BCR21788.1 hypothetical protein BKFM_00354 [Borrelia sp. HM]
MLSALKLVFLISYRFILFFFTFSIIFVCASYLKYNFLYSNLSIVNFKLYYDAYCYVLPFALVCTFMRIAYPFNLESFKLSKTLYIVIFMFILLLSYFGFLALFHFNSIFLNVYSRDKSIIKDGVVHFFDDKIIFYSNDVKSFGFKGVLKVKDNGLDDENLKTLSYNPDFFKFNTINLNKSSFLTQKLHDSSLMSAIFNDLDTLNNFFLSLETYSLIFNIFGFSLLLFAFCYTFNFIFSSCFSFFLYPIFVILFFKVYNIYAVEFPESIDLLMGKSAFSNYVPFVFCLITFFSAYLVGFVSDYIRVDGKFDSSLH